MENVNKISVKLTENINQYSICIGRCGEYGVTLVEFDIAQYIEKYGDITVTLTFALPYSTQEFLVPTIVQDKKIMWLVGNDATKEEGTGTARIRFYRGGEKLKKTPKILCKILEGGSNSLDPPQEEYKDWITRAQELLEHLTGYAWSAEDAKNYILDYIEKHKEELKGEPGKKGDSYTITEADYQAIADKIAREDFAKNEDLLRKLDRPDGTPKVGDYMRIKAIADDGTYQMEWVDAPTGGGNVDDVTVDGKSVVDENGNAVIPIVDTSGASYGFAKYDSMFGFDVYKHHTNGSFLRLAMPSENQIKTRTVRSYAQAVSLGVLDSALKIGLGDGKILTNAPMTADEQANAQAWLGIKSREYKLYREVIVEEDSKNVVIDVGNIIVNGWSINLLNQTGIVASGNEGGFRIDVYGSYTMNTYINVSNSSDKKWCRSEMEYLVNEKAYIVRASCSQNGYGALADAYMFVAKSTPVTARTISLSFVETNKLLAGTKIMIGIW